MKNRIADFQPVTPPPASQSVAAPAINVLALVKGEDTDKTTAERYVFLYDDTPEGRTNVLRVMGRFATNPELSFTWYDAAMLSQKVRGVTIPKSAP